MTEVYRPGLKRSWFALQYNEAANSADLYLYDDIGFFGITANDVKEQLLSLKADTLNVYVNSNGGEIDAGLAIYNMLKRHSAKKTVYIDGIAASMASVIAMAGDKVVMPETALMFVHKPWTIAAGNADDLQKTAEQLDKWEAAIVAAYVAKTGASSAIISEMLRDERLLSASEAVELGFADEVEEVKEPAFAYRGAMTARVLCHLSKRTNKEQSAMPEPEQSAVEPVVEPVAETPANEAEPVAAEPVVDPVAAPVQADARAEFKQFVARFGAVRAANYFEAGLAFADAERRFTDELIAENADLRARSVSTEPVRPVAVKIEDGDNKPNTWPAALASCGNDYAEAKRKYPELCKSYKIK